MRIASKTISIAVASAAMLSGLAFAGTANAATQNFNCQGGTFTQNDIAYCHTDAGVTVAAYYGSDATLDVPAEVYGMKVAGIGANGNKIEGNRDIKQVRVAGDISVNPHALRELRQLETVDLTAAKNLTIGTNAFADDVALKDVTIPADADGNKVEIGIKPFIGSGLKKTFDYKAEDSGYAFANSVADANSDTVTFVAKTSDQQDQAGDQNTDTDQNDQNGGQADQTTPTARHLHQYETITKLNETYNRFGVNYVKAQAECGEQFWVAVSFDGYNDDVMHIASEINNVPVTQIGFAGEGFTQRSDAHGYTLVTEGDIAIMPGAFAKPQSLKKIDLSKSSVIYVSPDAVNSSVEIVK